MNTELFYANLPSLDNFIHITNSKNFSPVPSDWYILVTDIVNSSKFLKSGRYKDVNLIGACSIVAVLNIAEDLEIPFVFGGDGATILIPPSLYSQARRALSATQKLAKEEFKMNLRVGAVPVSDVLKAKYEVKVTKLRVSENYHQAVFMGGGLSYATQLVKSPTQSKLYNYEDPEGRSKANFSGLECRWQDIPSKQGEIISLIVRAVTDHSGVTDQIYRELIEHILWIYGSEESLNPITKEHLKLAFSYKHLKSETRLRAKSSDFLSKAIYFYKSLLENFLGCFLMKFKIQLPDINWGIYKDTVIAATDYKKFDDMLRMVITSDRPQRKKLTRYLEKNYQKGKLVYGLHISDRALMTCIVFERNGRQVHFVDGADGGYTAAATAMKHRVNRQRNLTPAAWD